MRPNDDRQEESRRVRAVPNAQNKQEKDVQRMTAIPRDVLRPNDDRQEEPRRVWAVPIPNAHDKQEKDVQRVATIAKPVDHEIDISTPEVYSVPPPPPPPPPPSIPTKKVIVEPTTSHSLPTKRMIVEPTTSHRGTTVNQSLRSSSPPTFAKCFTIASLQQYTNSFSQENLIGGGMLGNVYRAELPDGKVGFLLIGAID